MIIEQSRATSVNVNTIKYWENYAYTPGGFSEITPEVLVIF